MIDLTQMAQGEDGEVVEIQGGVGIAKRLEALGIRTGVRVKKVSSQLFRGPVIIQLDNTQLAIGYGVAKKLLLKQYDFYMPFISEG